MKNIIFQQDQWQRIMAVCYIAFVILSIFMMLLGIIFTFAEIKPADRFLTSCGFSLLVGLVVGIFTSPKSFSLLISIRSSEQILPH